MKNKLTKISILIFAIFCIFALSACMDSNSDTENQSSGNPNDGENLHQHSFTNYVSDNNATCTKDGTKTATCDGEGCNVTDKTTDIGTDLGHEWNNDGICTRCGLKNGLEYELSSDGTYYIVAGIGTETDNDIVILEMFKGFPVKTISANAFYKEIYIESVKIPNSITSIGDGAFDGCRFLEEIHISDIAAWCNIDFGDGSNPIFYKEFYEKKLYLNGSLITELVIPEGVTSISSNAFRNQSSITSVTIPSSVTSIGNYAFSGCTRLESITIPDSVTSIGLAFNRCKGLKNITIPGSVTSIDSNAFSGCTGLESVTIRTGVTSIDSNAFNGCTGLESVTIGNGVTSIGRGAFSGCTRLTSISIPDSVTSIGENAFLDCKNLQYNNYDNAFYLGNENNPYVALIKAKYTSIIHKITCEINSSTKVIGYGAFSDCWLTSIKIPASVISIDDYAFFKCGGPFEEVHISDIAAWCNIDFGNYYSNPIYPAEKLYLNGSLITELVIPDGVTEIPDNAFSNQSSITSVTIPSTVTSIGEYAFFYCTGLTSIEIPNSVTSIGENAFSGCTGLESVTFEENSQLESIGSLAFYECTELKSVTFEANSKLESIGSTAFFGCTGLTSITIPNSVTSIGDWAFSGCTGLKSITIPDGVTSIGSKAFYDCIRLEEVHISDLAAWCEIDFVYVLNNLSSTIYTSNPLYYAEKLYLNGSLITELVIPDGVTSISSHAFHKLSSITKVTIPNSVTSIGSAAFSGCEGLEEVHISDLIAWCNIDFGGDSSNPLFYANKLYLNGSLITELVVPEGVTEIKDYAFYNLSSITSVTIPSTVTSIGKDAFYGCTALKSITIPDSVTSIGYYAVYGCTKLTEINFNGTKAEWRAIKKGVDWNGSTGNYVVHCTDGDI